MSGFGAVELKKSETKEMHVVMSDMHNGLVAEIAELRAEVVSITKRYESEIDGIRLAHAESIGQIKDFFIQLAAETRKPHYGEAAKSIIGALLLRAQEAGAYAP